MSGMFFDVPDEAITRPPVGAFYYCSLTVSYFQNCHLVCGMDFIFKVRLFVALSLRSWLHTFRRYPPRAGHYVVLLTPSRRPAKPSWGHTLRLATRHIMPLRHWHGCLWPKIRYSRTRQERMPTIPFQDLHPTRPKFQLIRWAESTCPPQAARQADQPP